MPVQSVAGHEASGEPTPEQAAFLAQLQAQAVKRADPFGAKRGVRAAARLWTWEDVGELLGVSVEAVYALRKRGILDDSLASVCREWARRENMVKCER